MIYWLVVGNSCEGCDIQGATLMEHEPTAEEIALFMEELGGMYCIRVNLYKIDPADGGLAEPCKESP